mgnify:CR=1 FL=1
MNYTIIKDPQIWMSGEMVHVIKQQMQAEQMGKVDDKYLFRFFINDTNRIRLLNAQKTFERIDPEDMRMCGIPVWASDSELDPNIHMLCLYEMIQNQKEWAIIAACNMQTGTIEKGYFMALGDGAHKYVYDMEVAEN